MIHSNESSSISSFGFLNIFPLTISESLCMFLLYLVLLRAIFALL
jgi:hypothetical protein